MFPLKSLKLFRPFPNFFLLAALATVVFALCGCLAPLYPAYTGTEGFELADAQPFKEKNIEMMLPSGWRKSESFDLTKDSSIAKIMASGTTTFFFEKEKDPDGSVIFVTGYGGMIGGGLNGMEFLKNSANDAVNDIWPDNKSLGIPHELRDVSGTLKPAFRMYEGKVVKDGKSINFDIYAGWKGGMGFGTKYILIVASPANAEDLFDEFLFMLRSLK